MLERSEFDPVITDTKSNRHCFNEYELNLESEDSIDALIVRGRLLHQQKTLGALTVISDHKSAGMSNIVEVDENGCFETRLRKNDDYTLRFLSDDNSYSIDLGN